MGSTRECTRGIDFISLWEIKNRSGFVVAEKVSLIVKEIMKRNFENFELRENVVSGDNGDRFEIMNFENNGVDNAYALSMTVLVTVRKRCRRRWR